MTNINLKRMLSKEVTRKDFLGLTGLAVISLFGSIGIITALLSRAASPYTAEEAEDGTLSESTSYADTKASGGQAVQFGDTAIPNGGPTGVTWALDFHDDFNGSSLDTSKWATGWFSGGATTSGPVNTSGYETAGYAAANISFSNGMISFAVSPNTTNISFDGTVYPNVGAQITSDVNQGASSGYLTPSDNYYCEYSGQIPSLVSGNTAIPMAAFWQDPVSWPIGFEVDVMESYGTDASPAYHLHYPASAGSSAQYNPAPGASSPVLGATTGQHTYGVLIEVPDEILTNGRATYYYDGIMVGQIVPALPFPNDGRYIVIGASVGGSGVLPGVVDFLVDYVRVWTYTGTLIMGTPPN